MYSKKSHPTTDKSDKKPYQSYKSDEFITEIANGKDNTYRSDLSRAIIRNYDEPYEEKQISKHKSFDNSYNDYRSSNSSVRNLSSHSLNRNMNNKEPPTYEECYALERISVNSSHKMPLGLPNTKSYCFINSVVQSLKHCHEFVIQLFNYELDTPSGNIRLSMRSHDSEKIVDIDTQLIAKFAVLTRHLAYRDEDELDRASDDYQQIHDFFPQFAIGQHDADEYLQFLLNKLNDVTKLKNSGVIRTMTKDRRSELDSRKNRSSAADKAFEAFYSYNQSFVTDLFCGQMDHQLCCKNCFNIKSSFQVFWVLSLPIFDWIQSEPISLSGCLSRMSSLEKVDVKECGNCHARNTVSTRTAICHWPKYLIIHLNRRAKIRTGEVNRTLVSFDIKEHLVCQQDEVCNEKLRYSLLGVIDHCGTLDSGHYYAKFRDLNDLDIWWCLNDRVISQVVDPATDVISGETTTYFFQR